MRPIIIPFLVLVLLPLSSALSCKSGWEMAGGLGSSSIESCPNEHCTTITTEYTTNGTKVETTKWACGLPEQCEKAGCRTEEKTGIKRKTCCCKGDNCNDDPNKEHARVVRRAASKTKVAKKNTTPRPRITATTTKAKPFNKATPVATRAKPTVTTTRRPTSKTIFGTKVTKALPPVTPRPQTRSSPANKVASRPVFPYTTKPKPYSINTIATAATRRQPVVSTTRRTTTKATIFGTKGTKAQSPVTTTPTRKPGTRGNTLGNRATTPRPGVKTSTAKWNPLKKVAASSKTTLRSIMTTTKSRANNENRHTSSRPAVMTKTTASSGGAIEKTTKSSSIPPSLTSIIAVAAILAVFF